MVRLKVDEKYRFVSLFDPHTGLSIRSNVYEPGGVDTGNDPFQAGFPELLDIGIMGSCVHGRSGLCTKAGIECYQDGPHLAEENMPLARFKDIIDQGQGRIFQVALGGRGDPETHPDFVEILRYCREKQVVPNFTTSGLGLRPEMLPAIKEYCGAVAVSWYRSSYTLKSIELLLGAGIKTNIHYWLSRATIDEAISRVEHSNWPEGINRIIFLLHKPIGLGRRENVLSVSDPRVRRFFSLFDRGENARQAGFDSCSVPALLNFTSKIHPLFVEPCEASRFSAYISPDLTLYPCSFAQEPSLGVSLDNCSIEEAWNSEKFAAFRRRYQNGCQNCPKYKHCLGGCPVIPAITLCPQHSLSR
ncbi:MAG: SPASM domain-containing protein [Firmicutes bacterium]|nr:SPASM domain-containing protein [Bacillota bacterium]MCL5040712.1 SPASM domain-containing protein [Bacillota bacterium]